MKYITIAFIFSFLSFSAFALDLQQARSGGQVGEQLNGYIAPITPSTEVTQLVAEVNAARQKEYQRISQENGQPVDVVAKLAAQQIITKLAPGSLYQSTSGGWQKR